MISSSSKKAGKKIIPLYPPLVSDPERSLTRREKGGWGGLALRFYTLRLAPYALRLNYAFAGAPTAFMALYRPKAFHPSTARMIAAMTRKIATKIIRVFPTKASPLTFPK